MTNNAFVILYNYYAKEAEERENMAEAMNYEEEGFDNRQERKTKISKLHRCIHPFNVLIALVLVYLIAITTNNK